MLNIFKNLKENKINIESASDEEKGIMITTLLVEAAKSDDAFDEQEISKIKKIISNKLHFDEDFTNIIFDKAVEASQDNIELYSITKDIKDNFKIPVLAKDFFIDPYQVALSKSYGCDCILIIIAALDKKLADEIYAEALKHNLSVIVEVHNEKEADTALKYDQALIGINNRNLKTLDISINNTISMFEILKNHKGPLISESGIKDEKDAKYIYEKTGIKNFLIGESLLKSDNTAELMRRFTQIIQWNRHLFQVVI